MNFARSIVLRRWYFLSLGLLFALLVTLRLTVLRDNVSPLLESSASVVDNLIAATLTALIAGAAYVYLYPAESHALNEVVRSADIARIIEDECRVARDWNVRSRAANYFTSVTLSNLIESALGNGRSLKIRVQCIDPENPALLEAYAEHMSDIRARIGSWTTTRARREVFASILRAAIKCHGAPRVQVEFGLSTYVWVMSLDISDHAALATCQNKGEDALYFQIASQFYRSYCDDFDATWRTCRHISPRIDMAEYPDAAFLSPDVIDKLSQFFRELGFPPLAEPEIREIVKLLSRAHDYA